MDLPTRGRWRERGACNPSHASLGAPEREIREVDSQSSPPATGRGYLAALRHPLCESPLLFPQTPLAPRLGAGKMDTQKIEKRRSQSEYRRNTRTGHGHCCRAHSGRTEHNLHYTYMVSYTHQGFPRIPCTLRAGSTSPCEAQSHDEPAGHAQTRPSRRSRPRPWGSYN